MAIRPSMLALVTKVAQLVSDPAFSVFTADYVQDTLDRYRTDYRMWPLTESVSVDPTTKAYAWLHYYAGGVAGQTIGDWEADAVVQSNTYADLTTDPGTSIDYLTGHVTFSSTQFPPVRWTGKTYDVWAAAADLCDERAAGTSDQYAYSDQGQTLNREQVPVNWQRQAAIYRKRARPRTSLLARSDSQYQR